MFHLITCCTVGPGAVEAIANGCPFIQPKFNPPFSKDNNVCLYIQCILDVHTWGTYWTYKHGVHTGRTYIGYILDIHTWGTYWTYIHRVYTGRTYMGYILDAHTTYILISCRSVSVCAVCMLMKFVLAM